MPGAGLKRLGRVLHLSKSGNLILRLESPDTPPAGVQVCDHKIEKVGTVESIFGPVNGPYVSIRPFAHRKDIHQGRVLYQLDGH